MMANRLKSFFTKATATGIMWVVVIGAMAQEKGSELVNVQAWIVSGTSLTNIEFKEDNVDGKEKRDYRRCEASFIPTPLPIAAARDIKAEFERIKAANKNDNDAFNIALTKFKKAKGFWLSKSGFRQFRVSKGMAILIIDEQDNFKLLEYIEGKTKYDVVTGVSNMLQETTVAGKNRVLPPPPPPTDTGDGTVKFPCRFYIEKGLLKESTRVILQCTAIDCDSGNIIDYCRPLVYEGAEYHDLQNKRKDFDYFGKDPLGTSYVRAFDHFDSVTGRNMVKIEATIKYVKPDKKKNYRGSWVCSLEDYHRPYHKDEYGGSCLLRRPFKFLNLNTAIPEMELTEEFQEPAASNERDMSTNLDLKFNEGRTTLIDDSVNNIEKEKLIKELRSYGSMLLTPTIIGGASPDGNDISNSNLAESRAKVARRLIEPYISADIKTDYKVYTWNDVADGLENNGFSLEANEVRKIVEDNPKLHEQRVDALMRALPYYEEKIKPILVNLRIMRCEYKYIKFHVFTADEVVEEYYINKQKYLGENGESFSNGDYFNLFASVTDSAELDTITMMAYRDLIKQKDYVNNVVMAPYVMNRMQRLLQRQGKADTMMLKPFLRLNYQVDSIGIDVFKNVNGVSFKFNRRDLVVTQAMSYYQLQNFEKALSLIGWMKALGKTVPGLEKLEHFMNLRSCYGSTDPEKAERFRRAKEYVLSLSNENKAIIYTECPELAATNEIEQGRVAEEFVDMMDDKNPKKWYLKAILWSRRADNPQPDLLSAISSESDFVIKTEEEENSLMMSNIKAYNDYLKEKDEYMKSNKEFESYLADTANVAGVPHYLAYFHHCFKMNADYHKMYYEEGQVDDQQRKKFKYLRKHVPAYDKLFKLLRKRDEQNRNEVMVKMGLVKVDIPEVPEAPQETKDEKSSGAEPVSETSDEKQNKEKQEEKK